MSTSRHWSEGTPFEHVKAAISSLDGQYWPLSPDNPVPSGYFLDRDGRLFASTEPAGPVTDGGLVAAARVDRYLAEAKAAGWSPVPPLPAFMSCGSCTPCRNAQPDRCIAPNGPTAKARAVERERWRAEAEEGMVVREAQAHAFSWVSTVDEEAERGRRRAEVLRSLA